eukprot:TRINITY_DN19129_c0_g4_i1.p1 TRINITY_DN19129_c0_g4~~TRINITY_DN19129_c0_g4_i1.p1  ORF type:complete len:182 (-),score=13.64 TRINITY_DN19129_c0_g4_i1:288-833(-)
MLLPGGATEAFKSQKNKYKLIWSEQSEFVRMAARFGVTIVPFSSVGAEDGYRELISAEDLLNWPIVGQALQRNNERVMSGNQPRAWQSKDDSIPPLVPPIGLPSLPERYYIKMGRPIKTSNVWVKDKDKCNAIYTEVKTSVEEGLEYLLTKRQEDTYREFMPRILYEASWKFHRQAPTFVP